MGAQAQSRKHSVRLAFGWRGGLPLILLLLATIGCISTGGTATPTPTPTPTGQAISVVTQPQSTAATATPITPTPTPPTPTATTPTLTPTPTTPTPTATEPTPTPGSGGPYVVKQVETLGGETISGGVCSLTQPFLVHSTTPKVTFNFVFVPLDAKHGSVTYVYSIPSAGESHDAKGTYTISPPDPDGTLHLSLSVSDHVVFHGFDGNIPLSYKFDLVPAVNVPCP